MINRDHDLSSKQSAALGISRGSVYYEPSGVSESDLVLMRRLDELHLKHPHAGSRMLREGREASSSIKSLTGALMRPVLGPGFAPRFARP